MAATENSGGGGLASMVGNAREFAEERLREADEAMSPAELADEYNCSAGHMRNELRDLRSDGVVSRPEKGRYQCPPGEDTEVDTAGAPEMQPEDEGPPQAEASVSEADGDADPSADGGPHSEGRDTEEEDGPSGRDAAIVGGATGAAAAFPAMLDEMSTRQMLALVAVVIVAAYLITRDGSDSSSGTETATSSTGGAADQDEQQSGGLVQ